MIGSINRDLVALVQRHPRPGETGTGSAFERLAGGKGLNQAVAAARAGAPVAFVGAAAMPTRQQIAAASDPLR